MKDTVLTARHKKRELIILLVCFILASLLNIYAIIKYDAAFVEIITSFFYVLSFTVVLYMAAWIFRLLYKGMKYLWPKRKKYDKV